MGVKLQPGRGGNIYVSHEERAGNESIVYFTAIFLPRAWHVPMSR